MELLRPPSATDMKRSKPIGLDSQLYMKRVVREVRKMIAAKRGVRVTTDGKRWYRVIAVEIDRFAILARIDLGHITAVPAYVNPAATGFRDDNDQEITASRAERN